MKCCYNCKRSSGCDYEQAVYCWKFKEVRDLYSCCEDFVPESFCADPYE